MIEVILRPKKLFCASALIVLLVYSKIPCYLSWSYPDSFENSSENLLNDDHNSTLEDTFQNYIKSDYHSLQVIIQNTSKIEEYQKSNYPYEKILNVMKSSKITKFSTKLAHKFPHIPLAPRTGILNATVYVSVSKGFEPSPCKEVYSRLYPIKGKGVDGKTYYIVNVKGFEQATEIRICHKSGSSCDEEAFPEEHTSRCEQKYSFVQLSTFPELSSDNITIEAESITTFRVHNGCFCKSRRLYNT